MGLTFFRRAESETLSCVMASDTNTEYTPIGVEYSTSPDIPDQKQSITYVPEVSVRGRAARGFRRYATRSTNCRSLIDDETSAIVVS